ncbi:PREDICTED: F-box protein At1g30790-like [Camelina sativa]|uniref:F-box protein At1g30790-like n=1 Tax=Camelina sativa TaxID=90675 RepID=A0ABM0Y4K2_CAMSA|nr:PREDICTED: F-box protein At1g30790-like [Camelina sativa]
MTISDLVYYIRTRPVNGFVCCTRGSSIAVCNPTTRQIVKLPDVVSNGRQVFARLGYDPVGDQYKVLCVMMFNRHRAKRGKKGCQLEHYVFTLQSQQKEWRKIEITKGVRYHDVHEGICINGAIYYYIAEGSSGIIRFDVRSEKLDLIEAPEESRNSSSLLNYNGKLGCVDFRFDEMVLWILEDAEKQEWSELRCAQPDDLDDLTEDYVILKGEIRAGELIMIDSRLKSHIPFSVFYYDFQRRNIRRVDIEGIADDEFRRLHGIGKRTREIWSFPGFVENIKFL